MAYTVEDGIAAVQAKQATLPANKAAYLKARVSIRESGGGLIEGTGPLMIPYYPGPLLGNLGWVATSEFWFLMYRGQTAVTLLGLDIEPVFTFAGVSFRPPILLRPLFQRLERFFNFKRRYSGHFAIYLGNFQRMDFYVGLGYPGILQPQLVGRITGAPLPPSAIAQPADVTVVLESVEVVSSEIG